MTAKKTIFPPQNEHTPFPEEEMYTGHPGHTGVEYVDQHPSEDASHDNSKQSRDAAKAKAAYGSTFDEMPSFAPKNKVFGGLGGLFGDSSAQAKEPAAAVAPSIEESLAIAPQDMLTAACRQRICPACPTASEAEDARLRALAELDNTKKRLLREHDEQARFAAEKILTDILPSLDNLDLALQHAGSHQECKNFVIGVQMTRKLLLDALAKHGLQQTGQVGDEFNPAFHEAVGMSADPQVPNGHICALLSSGYSLGSRLLRPAKVMVCKK